MSAEFFEPVGADHPLAHFPSDLLAATVIRDFVRYDKAQSLHADHVGGSLDTFRLSSLACDERQGYALAVPGSIIGGDSLLTATLYDVDRADSTVNQAKSLTIVRPQLADKNIYRQEVDRLGENFERDELEATVRMLGKMTCEMVKDCQDSLADSALPLEPGLLNMKRNKDVPPHQVDSLVLRALINSNLDELLALSRDDRSEVNPVSIEATHLSEWRRFNRAAKKLLEREAGTDTEHQEVAVMHDLPNGRYIVNLIGKGQELVSAELFNMSKGAWKGQNVDLNDEVEADDYPLPSESPTWDQRDILDTLKHGSVMTHNLYRSYAKVAMDALGMDMAYSSIVLLADSPDRQEVLVS